MCGIMGGTMVCGTIHNTLLGIAGERMASRLRKEYLRAVMMRDQAWYARGDPSDAMMVNAVRIESLV